MPEGSSSRSVSTAVRDTVLDGRGIATPRRAPTPLEIESQRDVRLAHDLYERARRAGHDVSLRWAMTQVIRSPVEEGDIEPLLACARDRGTRGTKPLVPAEEALLLARLKALRGFRARLGAPPEQPGRRADRAVVPVTAHLEGDADELHQAITDSLDDMHAALGASGDDPTAQPLDELDLAYAELAADDLDTALNAEVQEAMAAASATRAEQVADGRRKRRRKEQPG